jgi:hypothetical protein
VFRDDGARSGHHGRRDRATRLAGAVAAASACLTLPAGEPRAIFGPRQFQTSSDPRQPSVLSPRLPAIPAIAFPRFLKVVSTRKNQPRLNRMMEMVEKGELDLVVVEGIDRLSRNLIEVLGLLAELRRKGVALVSTNDDGSRRSGILDVLGLTKNC